MASTDYNFSELVSSTELKLLGSKERGIFYTQEVIGEGEKKNAKEKKKICVSSKRLYILNIQGKPPKLDLSISLLAICELTSSTNDKLTLAYNIDPYSDKAKQLKFEVQSESFVELLAAILSPLHSTLGKAALQRRLKVKITGEGRQDKLDEIVDENVARVSQGWQGGSVSEVYALLCDFFDISFHDEIAWDLENTYQTHSIRTLSLNHFDHFPTRDFVPLIRMLEFCPRFEGISADGIKLCSESFDALIHISKHSCSLHFLSLRGIAGLNHKIAQKMFAQGFGTNQNCVLEKVDLTDTIIEEKGVESLASSVQHFPLGLRELKLSGVGVSSKSFANFSKHFIKHSEISNTLTVLDLSNNHFSSSSSDLQAFLAFLAGNNRIQELSLASTNMPFEQLFAALQRGCTMHLTCLNISGNSKPAIGKVQTKSTAMQQFFQTAIGLKQVNLSNCKLSADLILQILAGLKENTSIFSLQMNLSQNDLNCGLKEIAAILSEITCIDSMDLSYTSLDSDFEDVIGTLLKNTSIKHLDISGNIRKHKSAAAKVLEESNSSKKCKLETLKLNDCKLGDNISYVLCGLIRNTNMKRLEISGNLMGPSSFRQLAKLINNNCVLEAIEFDDNLTNISSLNIIAAALENNFTIQEMAIHFRDIVKLKKENDREVEVALSNISRLLTRNQSPLKREQVLGGIRKRIDLLIAEQQLILDKKIVELEEEINLFDISNITESRREIISKANNLKAKASLVTTLCEDFYSNKLEKEISFRLSELINEQSKTALSPQILTYRDKIIADMLEKLEYSLGDVISKEKIEELKENLPASDNQNIFTEDTLSVFLSGLSSSVNARNLKMVEILILQTCELVVKEIDVMCQQVSNLETTEFPKSPDRNLSGTTSRLKLAFSVSMKRHRVSYSTFNPEFNIDTKSEDLDDLESDSQPSEISADPIPKIIETTAPCDVSDIQNVCEGATADSTQETATKHGKRFGKPKFINSLKGKKEKEDKDKKSKPAKRNDSSSSLKKVETDSLPDITTFDDLSKVAAQAPDLDMHKSKPRGPPRRPPRRKERTAPDIAKEEIDLFTEISNASAPGFENVPEAEDEPVVKDRSQLKLEMTDQASSAKQPEGTEEKKVAPPTSPRKAMKVPIGMGPGLASVLQGGLGKAKLAATKSSENIFQESIMDEDLPEKTVSSQTVRKTDSQPIPSKPKPKQRPDNKAIKPAEEINEPPVAAKHKLDTILDSTQDGTSKLKDTPKSPVPNLEEDTVSFGSNLEGIPPGAKAEDTPVTPSAKTEDTALTPSAKAEDTPETPSAKAEDTPATPSAKAEDTPATPSAKAEDTPATPSAKAQDTPVTPSAKAQDTPVTPSAKAEDTPVTPSAKTKDTSVSRGTKTEDISESPAAKIEESNVTPEKHEVPKSPNPEPEKPIQTTELTESKLEEATLLPESKVEETPVTKESETNETAPEIEDKLEDIGTVTKHDSISGSGIVDRDESKEITEKPAQSKVEKVEDTISPIPSGELTSSDNTEENIITSEHITTANPTLSPPIAVRRTTMPSPKTQKKTPEPIEEKPTRKTSVGAITPALLGQDDIRKSPSVSKKPILPKPQVATRPKPTANKPVLKSTTVSADAKEVKEKVAEEVPKKEKANADDDVTNQLDSKELSSSIEGNKSPPVKAKPTAPAKPKRTSLETTEMNQKPPSNDKEQSSEASNLPKDQETVWNFFANVDKFAMELASESQEIESSSPHPLTILPDYNEDEKICVDTKPEMFQDENHHRSTNITPPSPHLPVYSGSDKGNMSPLTQDSQSPSGGQELDLINSSYSDGEFGGELNIETPGKRRLKKWLVEQINSGKYEGLKWLTDGKTLFSVPWKHAREKTYCMDKDAALYKEWASYSGKHRKSEANPINWKLNFRCALYSVRGIKERKDVYIRGHRVYELTDNAGETPSKEYPQVPTQIPGFPKSNQETPDELSSCVYEDSIADLMPHYMTNSQSLGPISQSESLSSQLSVTTKLTNLNAFESSQGEITPSSPSLFNRSYLVMPSGVASSHLSPLTPITFDPSNSKINPLLPSPSTPGLHRLDANHDVPLSLLIPNIQSTNPKKKLNPATSYSITSTPSTPKHANGMHLDIPSTNYKQTLSSPAITSPAHPYHAISLVMPNTPTLPYPIQNFPIKASPIPYQLKSEVPPQFIRPEHINNNSHRQNLSLYHCMKREIPHTNNDSQELDNSHTHNRSDSQKRSLSSSSENLAQLDAPSKKICPTTTTNSPITNTDISCSISTIDMHTCGDPVRIVTAGYPSITGNTILEKRKYARGHLDSLRMRLMLEPRGHKDMFGVLPVTPDVPEADIAALFMNSSGYVTMCGHCIISLGRYALDHKLVKPQAPETKVKIQCPCGVVKVFVEYSNGKSGRVRFHSVPAFVYTKDHEIHLDHYGWINYDIAYGGTYYAIANVSQFKLNLQDSTTQSLSAAGVILTEALRRTVMIEHTECPELGVLAGVILIDDNDRNPEEVSANICVLADGQIARGPCGSGVTARIALQYYKGFIQLGDLRTFSGPSGGFFTGRALREEKRGERHGIVVEVSGQSFYTGEHTFRIEKEDTLPNGLLLK
ncbi:Trans-3-hydroxy-L-proline dehydratase [Oopsacas minuta]|uniref:trans-L-3-hydroxyproline dehydratase n=1 Tax=Oopsacas minuta TaxID=111878 RepID=A0AAV7JP64_9METZ|nr:Trans-3-hydroxy-L-proline dehydratase [Oopsacas minuta]